MKWLLQDQLWAYLWIRHRMEEKEHTLVKANQWFEWGGKEAIALYGLRDLIGEDSLNSALREFKNAYAFKNKPPFAGSNNNFTITCKSILLTRYNTFYLTDTWQKITLYDNKITNVTSVATGKNNEYRLTLKFDVAKFYIYDKGNDVPARQMNDYIDIGIFAADTKNKEGRSQVNPVYLKKYKFNYGLHTITVIVKGKPLRAGIDPV